MTESLKYRKTSTVNYNYSQVFYLNKFRVDFRSRLHHENSQRLKNLTLRISFTVKFTLQQPWN